MCAFSLEKPTKRLKFYISGRSRYIYIYLFMKRIPIFSQLFSLAPPKVASNSAENSVSLKWSNRVPRIDNKGKEYQPFPTKNYVAKQTGPHACWASYLLNSTLEKKTAWNLNMFEWIFKRLPTYLRHSGMVEPFSHDSPLKFDPVPKFGSVRSMGTSLFGGILQPVGSMRLDLHLVGRYAIILWVLQCYYKSSLLPRPPYLQGGLCSSSTSLVLPIRASKCDAKKVM